MVKNCDRGLENNARGRTAYGLGQYFQDRGHSFSPLLGVSKEDPECRPILFP